MAGRAPARARGRAGARARAAAGAGGRGARPRARAHPAPGGSGPPEDPHLAGGAPAPAGPGASASPSGRGPPPPGAVSSSAGPRAGAAAGRKGNSKREKTGGAGAAGWGPAGAAAGQPGAPGVCGPPLRGAPQPLGPSAAADGAGGAVHNFAVVLGAACERAWLVLLEPAGLERGRALAEVELSAAANRTGRVWHVGLRLERAGEGLLYGWRVAERGGAPGPLLLDPRARAVASRAEFGRLGPDLDDDPGAAGLGLGLGPCWAPMAAAVPAAAGDGFDWEGDRPPRLPMEDLVVYEAHVRGFTQDPSSGVGAPGTFRGMIEKLDHLERLGVNALELLPVHEFNELEYYREGAPPRYNYWGYSQVGFFAPMARYSADAGAGVGEAHRAVAEFKELVKECHRRGIEVILDVVFNHTAEGNEQGPTLSFRGLDERSYYMLAPGGEHYNYTGCGNTFNCNHPVARRLILDCLRYWVTEMHVDGFRFDLASILTRKHSEWTPPPGGAAPAAGGPPEQVADPEVPTGAPLADPPLIEDISQDPYLRDVKLIAEAWDCDGLNQVGAFPHYGGRWSEWNGSFRDTTRQFIKGTEGPWVGNFAAALCGSPDLYGKHEPGEDDWWGNHGGRKWRGTRGPAASVNFVTAHDGFTLADLVTYNEKRNALNGEDNRDGEEHNLSWNCGAEGPTRDPEVLELRARQQRNFMVALLVSQGVPMLLMGDEYGHTKAGNNNTYCHDTAINYFQWDAAEAQAADYTRFVAHLIRFRRREPLLRQKEFVDSSRIAWHGEEPGEPDWKDTSKFLAFSLKDPEAREEIYVAFNASHETKLVRLPPPPAGAAWEVVADTGKPAPYDFLVEDEHLSARGAGLARAMNAAMTRKGVLPVLERSAVILKSKPKAAAAAAAAAAVAAAAAPGRTEAYAPSPPAKPFVGGGEGGSAARPTVRLQPSAPAAPAKAKPQKLVSQKTAPPAKKKRKPAAKAGAEPKARGAEAPPSPPSTMSEMTAEELKELAQIMEENRKLRERLGLDGGEA